MFSHFGSSLVFSQDFLNYDLNVFHKGNGYLESLAERVDRLLQFRDTALVLYIDKMNTQGQLVYVPIQIPLFFKEKLKTLFLYLCIVPALIALVIKVITRIVLYFKYHGWESWSDQTDILMEPLISSSQNSLESD
ncbi:hypothetical protein [Chlamydia buteonis]|uniref:hypothetical protein n=1 Tax=Chlamydia buteonis TaxID=2494525 RepID=UPI00344FE195